MNMLAKLMRQVEEAENSSEKEPLQGTKLDAVLADLEELKTLYLADCPYKVGDVITPRKGSPQRGRGVPYVVVEVFDQPVRRAWGGDEIIGSPIEYSKLDLRVLSITGSGCRAPWMVESWMYEPWVRQDNDV